MKRVVLILTVVVLSITIFSCKGNSNSDSEAEISANDIWEKLPSDFPSDFYLLKGDVKQISSIKFAKKQRVVIIMHVKSEPNEVRAEILKNMEAKGWKTKMNMDSQQYFSKGKKSLRVGIAKDDNGAIVNYLATY